MTNDIIGADISKDHIDLHRLPDNVRLRVSNDRKGFTAIIKWIGEQSVERIVYEPTGAYHKAFERFMLTQGLALSKVNPHSAHHFAKAYGKRAKTDQMDAQMLAQYAVAFDLRLVEPKSQILNDLKELNNARMALIKDRTAARNRSKNIDLALLKKQNAQRLKQIETQIKVIDQQIIQLIKDDETLKARLDILLSIPGIANVTAFTLLIEMSELGSLDEKAVAALAGLAPIVRQSGKWAGRARIAGGRAIVRHALYMPALVATRFNPDLKAKYQALIAAGKSPKVAITAVMRKLIIIANALLRKNAKWNEKQA